MADEVRLGRDGKGADFEELLAVEDHVGGEVGDDVGEGVGSFDVEGGDDAEGGEGLEVVGAFEDVVEVGAFGADA